MIRQCAWCRKEMGHTEDHAMGDDRVTHAICEPCYDQWMIEVKRQQTPVCATCTE